MRVGHRVQARLLELAGSSAAWCLPAAAPTAAAGPRMLGGEHVAQGRLVQRLDRVGEEQAVAPGDEVVQVLHHHVPLVGAGPGPRHDVRLERVGQDGVVAGDDVRLLRDERGSPSWLSGVLSRAISSAMSVMVLSWNTYDFQYLGRVAG